MLAPLDTLTRSELEAIAAEPYEHRGILHSEMALLIHLCRKLEIEVFVESGRARGQSTYMLAKYLPDVEIHSIEAEKDHPDEAFARKRLRQFSNISLYFGDGAQGLIAFSGKARPKRTAVLCDGPKGFNAIAAVKLCFRFNHVKAGFIHDMRKGENRTVAEVMLPGAQFSDDPEYIAGHSWMDANVMAVEGPAGEGYERVFGCYGPTLGAFINNKT